MSSSRARLPLAFVCDLQQIEARQLAERTPPALGLGSWSILAAGIASKRWPHAGNRSPIIVCDWQEG
jgi:hypothetical protein